MAITKVSAALVDLDGGVVINESSADADFRVESNGNANMLFVDGGNDRVGIGTGTPDSILDIEAVHSQLRLTDSDDSKFVLFSYSSGKLIVRNNSTDTTDNIYTLQEDGNFGIGTHVPSEKLHIATSSGDCTLLIEAEENSSSREPHLQLKGTNTSSNPIIEFGDSAGFPGTIEYENSDNSMRFGTNAGERMRIDSSGNVGIGTTSPTNTLDLGAATLGRGLTFTKYSNLFSEYSNASLWLSSNFYANAGASGYKTSATGNYGAAGIRVHATGGASTGGIIQFYVDANSSKTADNAFTPTERMRIEPTGDVRFNIANAAITAGEVHTMTNASRGNNLALYTTGADQHYSIDMWNLVGGSCNQVQFRGGGSGAVTGTITSTGNNATQYNTSSDYRLKENVDYTWDATTRLKQLKPAQFNWITDETNTAIDGFLAHEVSSVVPQAVTGEKDAVYEDGEPKYQGIDHSVLVPLLVKTIQELEARITTLEG